MDETTLIQFKKVVTQLYTQREVVDRISDSLDIESKKLEALKSKIVFMLDESGMEKFHTPGVGTVSVRNRFTVTTPKSLEDKEKFFQWLRERGIFTEVVSVNSQKLNSLYQEEIEKSLADGEPDFSIPGIPEPKVIKTLSIRKE